MSVADLRNAQDVAGGVKLCSRCRRTLPLSAFSPKPHPSSGFDSWCRPCRAVNNREWRAKRKAAAWMPPSAEATILLKAADGSWTRIGVDGNCGIVPEGVTLC